MMNTKTQKCIIPSHWEDVLKSKDINDHFSHDGINNYTTSQKKVNNDYDFDFEHIIESDNNIDDDNNLRRVILSTPFTIRPIISYGLMVFAKDTKRWVIVRDKHSPEYILLMKGYYRRTFTKLLLSKLTSEESKKIIFYLTSTVDVFANVYLNELKLAKIGLLFAIVRMAESRNDILEMINDLDVSENTLPWTWPKGRIQSYYHKETNFECAMREFKEEVEIDLPPSILSSDNYIEESTSTLTGRKLESRLWIYVIPNELELSKPINHPEVCERIWVDTETCIKFIPKAINHAVLLKKVVDSTS